MMPRAFFTAAVSVLLWVFLPSVTHAETGFLDRSITFKGQTYRYQVFVPTDYIPTKTWPIVLFLHGNTRQGTDRLRQTNGGFANDVRQNPSFFPAIIVFAQAQPNTRWLQPEMVGIRTNHGVREINQRLMVLDSPLAIVDFFGVPRAQASTRNPCTQGWL